MNLLAEALDENFQPESLALPSQSRMGDILGLAMMTTGPEVKLRERYASDACGRLEGYFRRFYDLGCERKRSDPATTLVDYGLLGYMPRVGNFMPVDPIQAGNNLHDYVEGDPASSTDPTGLAQIIDDDDGHFRVLSHDNKRVQDRDTGRSEKVRDYSERRSKEEKQELIARRKKGTVDYRDPRIPTNMTALYARCAPSDDGLVWQDYTYAAIGKYDGFIGSDQRTFEIGAMAKASFLDTMVGFKARPSDSRSVGGGLAFGMEGGIVGAGVGLMGTDEGAGARAEATVLTIKVVGEFRLFDKAVRITIGADIGTAEAGLVFSPKSFDAKLGLLIGAKIRIEGINY